MMVRHVTKPRYSARRALVNWSRERSYLQRRKIMFDVGRSAIELKVLASVSTSHILDRNAPNLTFLPCT